MSALAPWLQPQLQALLAQRGHAWLLQGASGLGQYPLALAMASAWLCEERTPAGACGHCASCQLILARSHPDLVVLMPETVMLDKGWPLSEKAQSEIDDKKRKPSREIRVDAMRDTVDFSQLTSGWGRGKAVLIYPAERMNPVTANALLKTLEEPSGDVKFVLASEGAHQLLPTIRSRCLSHAMVWPQQEPLQEWLQQQDATAAQWLRAAGGRPEDALLMAAGGADPAGWRQLPKAFVRGNLAALPDWPAARMVDAMQKLCHDLMAVQVGGRPRFFEPGDLPARVPGARALADWSRTLSASRRTVEHPFNPGLMLEALVSQAVRTLNSGP